MDYFKISCLLFVVSALTYAESCNVVCQPGEFLLPDQCVCVGIDDYTPPPPPTTTISTTTADPNPTCTPIRCPLTFVPCSEYHVDKDGCPTCRCKCRPFSLRCPTHCKYGTDWTQNRNGCKVCACAPRPTPKPECPPVCKMYCPFGNVLDTDGCPTCACESGDGLPW